MSILRVGQFAPGQQVVGGCQSQMLAGAWPLAEGGGAVAYDLTGKNKSPLFGSPLSVSGPYGPMLGLNGSSQYVNITSGGFGALVGQGPFTVSVLAKTSITGTRQAILADWNSSGVANSFNLEFTSSNFFFSNINNVSTNISVTSSTTYAPNILYRITVTWDGSTQKLYVGGVLLGSTGTTTIGPGYQLSLGRGGAYIGGLYLNGACSDLRIYKRALSAAEVQSIYLDPVALVRPVRQYYGAASLLTYAPSWQLDLT